MTIIRVLSETLSRPLLTALILFLSLSICKADFILHYKSGELDPFLSMGFSSLDRITGTVTFDHMGATSPNSATLSTTINGSTAFTFDFADLTSLDPSDNTFGNWSGGVPESWTLNLVGNLIGGTENELIFIDDFFGDLAIRDEGASSQIGAVFASGSFAAVPEPSSLILVSTAITGLLSCKYRRKRGLPQ